MNGIILNRINRAIALDDVHVFSPTFLLNFRYGVTQQEFPERRVSQGFDLTTLGLSPKLMQLIPEGQSAIPNVRIGSLTQLSASESGDGVASSLVHTFVGNFNWTRGNHNLRFGPEFRLYRVFNDRHSSDNSPIFDFSNLWGKGPNNTSTAPPVGGELVSVLLGIPGGSITRSGSFATQDSQRRWDFSLNKTFRVNERAKFRFRADTFNALNDPVLRGPNTTATNDAFGKITAQEPPRSFQFSLQMMF